MNKRIKNKINEIEGYLKELDSIKLRNFKEYTKDFKTKAACERYFEKISESLVDLAILVIRDKALKLPEDDKEAFDILEKDGVIPGGLAKKMKDMKGMRNIIAHQYSNVNDELMFIAINEEITDDAEKFLEIIKHICR